MARKRPYDDRDVSRLGLVVKALDWYAEGRRFDSPLRLTFLFKNCGLCTLSGDFVLAQLMKH